MQVVAPGNFLLANNNKMRVKQFVVENKLLKYCARNHRITMTRAKRKKKKKELFNPCLRASARLKTTVAIPNCKRA